MKKSLLLLSMLLITTFVWSQRVIKGSVTEAGSNKEPIIGANVIAKGTTAFTTTDIDGNYTLTVPKGATQIEISYVGMTTQTISLGASNTIDVVMKGDKTLEEVVVVGYGTQKRKDLTGSITSITSENFVKGAIQTPEQLVAGKVAGVQITSNGGAPGSGSTIRIRGGSSLNASNEPLIVIDGVPVDNGTINGAANPLSLINPSDIESITVLKDASATAIYGSRAANGVIMIVSKKGVEGKAKVNFSSMLSLGQPIGRIDVLDAAGYKKALLENFPDSDTKNLLGNTNTDWQNEIYRNAFSHDNNLSVTGTVGKSFPYRASVNYLNQDGILLGSNMKRQGASVGLNPSFFNNTLKVDVNYRVSQIKNQFADQGAIGGAISFDPTQLVYASGKQYEPVGGFFEFIDTSGNLGTPRNPVALLKLKKDKATILRQIGNVQLSYALPFIQGLRANLNIGFDASTSNGEKRNPAKSAASYENAGYYGEYAQNKLNKLMEAYLNYGKKIGNSNLDVTLGHSYQNFYNETRGFDLDSIPDPAKPESKVKITPQVSDTSRNVLLSFFSRINYNYAGKYFLTGTLRADGSSRFAPETRWGYFPSAAVAWKINEEGFLKGSKVFSDLKLRLGYGITGQQDINSNYAYLSRYVTGQKTVSYIFGKDTIRTVRPQEYDRNLKWERTATYNAAVDFGFFNGKIFGSVDFYQRNTSNLISEIDVPAGSNLKNTILTNIGSLSNKGFEVVVNYNAINNSKMNWSIGANLTRNKNEITKLPTVSSNKQIGIPVGNISGVGQKIQIQVEGFPRNSFYVYKQKYNDSGKPMEDEFEDTNGDGIVNEKDQVVNKSPDPKIFLGFNSQLTYKNFSAGFTMRGSFGNYVYNDVIADKAYFSKLKNDAEYPNNIPTETLNGGFKALSDKGRLSDYYLSDASFIRMDNIFVGYNLKVSKVNIGVNFNVSNAFVITKYKGIDPEIFSGIDNNIYPRPRTYALGINVGF
jgi:TonB-dependent starch-binding outer membrane protein SusC